MKKLLFTIFSTCILSIMAIAQIDNHNVPITATEGTSAGIASIPLGMERVQAPLTEVADFEAFDRPTGVQIEWKSLEERNNGGFQVLRSRDGQVWSVLGFIPGQNVSSQVYVEYEYFDQYPNDGDNYYQLRKIYLNGTSAYSEPIRVWYRGSAGSYGFTVYPNPATPSTQVFVKLENAPPSATVMNLYDMKGHLISQYNITDFQDDINLGSLASGMYVLSTQIGEDRLTKRLVVN